MAERAMGTFEQRHARETEYAEAEEGPRLVRVRATNVFRGEMEGQGEVEHLMLYSDEETGSFVGLERVTGTVAGHRGSFVLQHSGVFSGEKTRGKWFVVAGSGTGALSDLAGEGAYVHDPEQTATTGFALDYTLNASERTGPSQASGDTGSESGDQA